MPSNDSSGLSKPCHGCGKPFEGKSPRWQAAIINSLGGDTKNLGAPTREGRGWHWVNVCTPCFWLKRTPKGVGKRGPLLEGEIA